MILHSCDECQRPLTVGRIDSGAHVSNRSTLVVSYMCQTYVSGVQHFLQAAARVLGPQSLNPVLKSLNLSHDSKIPLAQICWVYVWARNTFTSLLYGQQEENL